MSYTPPVNPMDVSWGGAKQYSGPIGNLPAAWQQGLLQYIGPASASSGATLATPSLQWTTYASPEGIQQPADAARQPQVTRDRRYIRPQYILDASWVGADAYNPPAWSVIATWADLTYISPTGIHDDAVGTPLLIWQQFITPAGVDWLAMGRNNYALYPWEYAPPEWRIDASWVGRDASYVPPNGAIDGVWTLPSESKYLTVIGWESSAFGMSNVEGRRFIAYPEGIAPAEVPRPHIENTAAPIKPIGILSYASGNAEVWNWWQFAYPRAFKSDVYGEAFVLGGVKLVNPPSIAWAGSGRPLVINTTADQHVGLSGRGIPPAGVGSHNVSPRTVWLEGIYATAFGYPRVYFPPRPEGWLSTAFGYPVVADRTFYVTAGGIDSLELGFPSIRDRAQKILHRSSPTTSVFGDVIVRLEKRYVYPAGYANQEFGDWSEVRNTRRPVYPSGALYTSYGDHHVANKTPALWPVGIASQVFGGADVGYYYRTVEPSGVIPPYPQVMPPWLWQTPGIHPKGIAAPAIDKPSVWPSIRRVSLAGFESLRFGQSLVDFSWRRLRLEENGIKPAEHGVPIVWHFVRKLDLDASQSYMEFGRPWVSRGLRSVEPEGIDYPYMSNHMVGTTRYVGAEGWDSVRWLTRIIPEQQTLEQVGKRTDVHGLAGIENRTRSVFPLGVTTYPEPFMNWGVARFWNRTQVITQYEDLKSGLAIQPLSKWTLIENRNKVIGAIGFAGTRFGYNLIANNARVIEPVGIADPKLPDYQKTGSVTHWSRPLLLTGIEPPITSSWSVVYNKAIPLKPNGLVATEFGRAEIVNTRRYRRMVGFDAYAFGHTFVSFAIRELEFEGRYSIQPPPIRMPDVRLHTRYIDPPSLEEGKVAQEALIETRFNRVRPRWDHRDLFGEPALKNLTPEYLMRGWDTSEWGNTNIRLEWRGVQAEGYSHQLFGKATISDRTRTIDVHGFNEMKVSDKLIFIRIGADPIVTQYIDLRRFILDDNTWEIISDEGEGYGIRVPTVQVSVPNLLKGYIFHGKDGGNREMTLWGNPYITANTIRVEPGLNELSNFGETAVSASIRSISVPSMGQLVNDSVDSSGGRHMGSWGKPALSPHTIYAVVEANAQARRNHGIGSAATLRPVNAGARLGSPRVNQHLSIISPKGIPFSGYNGTIGVGRPVVHNKLQRIYPKGSLMQRLGWAVIPGDRKIVFDDEDALIGPEVFGRPSVKRPPEPPFVKAGGILGYVSGRPVIDFYHRTLKAQGVFSQAMGFSRGDTRNMPQSLHVGPPNLHLQVGFDSSDYGEVWVSHRVRGVEILGWDSFICDYSLEHFDQRMRVKRNELVIEAQRVDPEGFVSHHVSAANVLPGLHFIRPDGNSDQYRKGAF